MVDAVCCINVDVFVLDWEGYDDMSTVVGTAYQPLDTAFQVFFVEAGHLSSNSYQHIA